jgi:hypothetical protein
VNRIKKYKTEIRVLTDGSKLLFNLSWYENEDGERTSAYWVEDPGLNGVEISADDARDLLVADGFNLAGQP